MRQYLSSLVIVMLGVACGGSTGTDEPGTAGSSAGGNASAGSNHGGGTTAGSNSSAGKTSGGSSSGGSSSGGSNSAGSNNGGTVSVAGFGGTTVTAGTGSGGTGIVNPDCPARIPMGTCSADDANISCQYEPGTGCLCYPSAPGTFTPCQKVDPTCTFMATPAAPPPDAGVGGVSAKVALPPHQICRCVGTTWMCTFGI